MNTNEHRRIRTLRQRPEKRAYILADNKLAEKAGWDREIVAIELQSLINLDFDMELTGFEIPEIDVILDEADEAKREARMYCGAAPLGTIISRRRVDVLFCQST